MTTIAWDGETLASDKQMTVGSLTMVSQKIIKHGSVLIGKAGASEITECMLQWYLCGQDANKFPDLKKDGRNGTLLIIHQDGNIEKYSQYSPYPIKLPPQKISIGSGSDIAMTAMYLGRSAVSAIEIASELDPHTGNGTDVLKF